MYLNVVAFAQREGAASANDNVQVKTGGELKRTRYLAP